MRISSSLAGGSRWKSVLIFLHICPVMTPFSVFLVICAAYTWHLFSHTRTSLHTGGQFLLPQPASCRHIDNVGTRSTGRRAREQQDTPGSQALLDHKREQCGSSRCAIVICGSLIHLTSPHMYILCQIKGFQRCVFFWLFPRERFYAGQLVAGAWQ
jgi:hypothetical protein